MQTFSKRRPIRHFIGKAWLSFFGWHIEGEAPPVPKAVIIAAPHTSNWDLPFMLAISFALDVEISWIGKHTLFKPPFGTVMRWLGGVPVDRRERRDAVAASVDVMAARESLYLVVPPEGTRKRTDRWKTGFYYIAAGANVPIILGFLDYERKCGGLGQVFHPTGNIEADMPLIRAFYSRIQGKFPHKMSDTDLGKSFGERNRRTENEAALG